MSDYDYGDDDFDGLDDADYGDEVSLANEYTYDGPPALSELNRLADEAGAAGLPLGYGVESALAQEQSEWDQWRAERDERIAYEQHVADAENYERVSALADELASKYGEMHDARASAADGSLLTSAEEIHGQALREAYDSGDEQTYAWLMSPQGAETAIAAAAVWTNNEAIMNRALGIIAGRQR